MAASLLLDRGRFPARRRPAPVAAAAPRRVSAYSASPLPLEHPAYGRFHHPVHAAEWVDPAIDAAYNDVWQLLMNGLRVAKSG